MASTSMSIQQAAQWAERKDCLNINGHTDDPMCAAYSANTHQVAVIGSFDKCREHIKTHCDCAHLPRTGAYYPLKDGTDQLRMECLETVLQEMDESEGEARCIPDPCEVREWS